MNSLKYQQVITKSLPPRFQSLSNFQFGKVIIEINTEEIKSLNIKNIQFKFLGAKSNVFQLVQAKTKFDFPIKTSLWHFYQYLRDMKHIQLSLQIQNSTFLNCIRKVELIQSTKVLCKNYVKGNYIANAVQLCDIFDYQGQNKGYMMVKTKLQFDEEIHKQIYELMDFQSFLSNPEENNTQKQNIPQNNFSNQNLYKQTTTFRSMQNKENIKNQQNLSRPYLHDGKQNYEQQSRMIQDDIDRLIAQMQNKPYDSSRYIDNLSSNSFANTNSFVNTSKTVSNYNNANQRNNFHVNQLNTGQRKLIEFQNHPPNQFYQNRSKSPNVSKKYPPLPYHNKTVNQYDFPGNMTIYSQKSLSPGINSRRSLNKTQQLSHQKSLKNLSTHSISRANTSVNKGNLKIQIHQILGKQLQDDNLFLKVYINDQYDDVLSCKGTLEGEVIVYNQKTQISQCILNQIQKLRFQLQNWQNKVIFVSNFQMSRLISIPKLQGIFMLNFCPIQQEFYGNSIAVSQTMLKKIERPPTQKTLRITVSFTQQIQVLQIYLDLSRFSVLNFYKCKYKIPFTKQTVQFQPTQQHFNIFPHSKSYTKLMIQFWDQKSIIGTSEISLTNLKNITKSILQCNIQPIYLYDCLFPVKNLFTQNQVGKFKLLVCCGNVRQIQHVLNRNLLNRSIVGNQVNKSNHSEFKNLTQVEYDKKLGVYLKDRKTNQQIQIQVDQHQLRQQKNDHKQTYVTKKEKYDEQIKDHHQISTISENQFLENKVKQISLSKTLSMKLNQQKESQSDDQNEFVQNKNIKQAPKTLQIQKEKVLSTNTTKNKPQFVKQNQNFTKQNHKPEFKSEPPSAKVLKSLTKEICNNIKQVFSTFCENKFSYFLQLKTMCKPHLLFNFIDIDIFIKKMIELGISKITINQTLEILQPTNGMINFSLFNDFMMSLEVQGQIKQNLVPNKLFIKFSLQQYYLACCQQIDQSSKIYSSNEYISQDIDYTKWLSQQCLSQISTLDQSLDFNQMKKLFSSLGFKISMNQYNFIKKFLENENQIKSFLYEISQSKKDFQNLLKNNKNLYQMLKLCVVQSIIKRKKEEQINKKYQQNIIDRLYDSNFYGGLDEKKSLNQSLQSQEENIEKNEYQDFKFVKNNAVKTQQLKDKQMDINKKQDNSKFSNLNSKNIFYNQEDQQNFIINGLNNKPIIIDKSNYVNQILVQSKNHKTSQRNKNDIKDEIQPQIISTKRFKEKTLDFNPKNGQLVIKNCLKRKITVDGLQSCKSTYQCQLDQELQSPYFKVVLQSPYQKKLYFKESDLSNCQQFQIISSSVDKDEDQEIQGQVLLNDITKKGEMSVAAARFVVIKGIRSVYALKTFKQESFCGLINILIQ